MFSGFRFFSTCCSFSICCFLVFLTPKPGTSGTSRSGLCFLTSCLHWSMGLACSAVLIFLSLLKHDLWHNRCRTCAQPMYLQCLSVPSTSQVSECPWHFRCFFAVFPALFRRVSYVFFWVRHVKIRATMKCLPS